MIKHVLVSAFAAVTLLFPVQSARSQTSDSLSEKYVFTKKVELPATFVKDQSASGTCWSFATTSFIESEILRLKKDTLDLSEMFFARKSYEDKAQRYVRLHGTGNFGEGGQAHDVMNVVRCSGIIPDQEYSGLANGQVKPDHAEMESVLSAMLNALVKNPAGKLSPDWMKAFNAVLDVYLGKVPTTFSYQGKQITPVEYRELNSIHPDDYVEITSYQHHPFDEKFILEVPDNWSEAEYYNLSLDEFMRVLDNALDNGYTVDWDGDVSDKGFSFKNGLAIVPDISLADAIGTDRSRWEKLSEKERRQQFYRFDKIVPEKKVSQEMRQTAFDNYSATDDHLMHITGTATDQNGNKYYLTKNSWSAESNDMGGYLYLSVAYVRLNTIALMVHKDALPKDIRRKLNIN